MGKKAKEKTRFLELGVKRDLGLGMNWWMLVFITDSVVMIIVDSSHGPVNKRAFRSNVEAIGEHVVEI